ncbi:MAG: hypothetical protein ABI557_06325 [Aureliella sp.]
MEKDQLPIPLPPHIWCDFNACGWTGAHDDDCYYVLDFACLDNFSPSEGMSILLFDWDDEAKSYIIARLARLEKFESQWRARPSGDFYSGGVPWLSPNG